ncbi:MAG: AI-2E family transporter [Rhodospirillaceae bacterium]|nr:AI-2E family transporter [Rhodospirillaceae bacterium]|tara:strand:+ start:10165 stop:11250 length:1086 start_codon:yes stop_codon:yes gene_type:complete
MTPEKQTRFWLIGFAVFFAVIWLLSEILFPFVAGIALAYLLDPLADKLENWKWPRWVAAGVLTLLAVLSVVALMLLVIPLLQNQLVELSGRIPQYLETLRGQAADLLATIQSQLSDADMGALKQKVSGAAGPDIIAWVGGVLAKIWGGGVALLNLLSLLVITPIVMFYLLRDWDRIVGTVDGWLPLRHAETIRQQVSQIDEVLAAFVRGQMTVCILLGVFYAVALTLVGLDFGFIIGFGTGLISFVPYFGMLVGFVAGIGVAIAQFGELTPILLVAAVFVIGQFLEGNFITPKLVGDKIGLHPVWIIFALLAGGALFGFTGMLLAIPVAAVIGVVGRFGISKYKSSSAYLEETKTENSGDG